MPSILRAKSFVFAVEVVRACKSIHARGEFVLSRQLLKSGTAIGALAREAQYAESRADFAHKLSIALKEANETAYWIELLRETGHLTTEQSKRLGRDVNELLRILIRIVNSAKRPKPSSAPNSMRD